MRGDPVTIAHALDLKRSGGEWKGPCPICGGRDRFHIRRGHQHDLIVHCRQGCQFRELAGVLKSMGLIEDDRPRFETITEDRNTLEAYLRAFARDIDHQTPVSSWQKTMARQSIKTITGFTPNEFLDLYLWREAFTGNLTDPTVRYEAEDYEKFETVHKAVSGREWLIRSCACLISTHW